MIVIDKHFVHLLKPEITIAFPFPIVFELKYQSTADIF
jgi:hypothetical protein